MAKAADDKQPKLKVFVDRDKRPTAAHPPGDAKGNGIGCRNCGSEMHDIGNVMQTNPPTVRIECSNRACGYIDTRTVKT